MLPLWPGYGSVETGFGRIGVRLIGDVVEDGSGDCSGIAQSAAASGCSVDGCSGVVGAVDSSASDMILCSVTGGECVEQLEEKEAARLRRLVPCDNW